MCIFGLWRRTKAAEGEEGRLVGAWSSEANFRPAGRERVGMRTFHGLPRSTPRNSGRCRMALSPIAPRPALRLPGVVDHPPQARARFVRAVPASASVFSRRRPKTLHKPLILLSLRNASRTSSLCDRTPFSPRPAPLIISHASSLAPPSILPFPSPFHFLPEPLSRLRRAPFPGVGPVFTMIPAHAGL